MKTFAVEKEIAPLYISGSWRITNGKTEDVFVLGMRVVLNWGSIYDFGGLHAIK